MTTYHSRDEDHTVRCSCKHTGDSQLQLKCHYGVWVKQSKVPEEWLLTFQDGIFLHMHQLRERNPGIINESTRFLCKRTRCGYLDKYSYIDDKQRIYMNFHFITISASLHTVYLYMYTYNSISRGLNGHVCFPRWINLRRVKITKHLIKQWTYVEVKCEWNESCHNLIHLM